MNLRDVARQLGQLLVDALGVLAEQQRQARKGPVNLMRQVISHGPENLASYPDCALVAAEWGYSAEWIREAARVAAWDPDLAARVAAGQYWLAAAIEAERESRIGPWHVRHPGDLPPLPGPDDPLPPPQ